MNINRGHNKPISNNEYVLSVFLIGLIRLEIDEVFQYSKMKTKERIRLKRQFARELKKERFIYKGMYVNEILSDRYKRLEIYYRMKGS